ncbi:hypothetical protein LTR53_000152 [Teratosphaeriaceae sp. CCFEE 6253]|nr:hypothetical protein LTR53_000152 [Teratosphaeriaceae sp. CCFEE 6253]
MATYAEYPQQTMASNDNDFTLFPYVWNQEQTYLPTSTFDDQTYLHPTTLDSYAAQHHYANLAHDQFAFNAETFGPIKNSLQAPLPSYSPANSASHSFDLQHPPMLSSTSDSGASVQSTSSSGMNSPAGQHRQSHDWGRQINLNTIPGIVHHDSLPQDMYATTALDFETIPATDKGCVDPSLIQPTFSPTQYSGAQFPDVPAVQSPRNLHPFANAPASIPVKNAVQSPRINGKAASPSVRTQSWQPYPSHSGSRRQSISSVHSRHSQGSISSSDDSNKGLCPLPTCGRHVKDLKAHMLTHQNERPEKCPIPTCEYHTKGFARKYDKNRHTLTHYKGTMVCGFCPGSGSAAEKSFNRADVFKRHLTSVHGVEQTPPNARRKSPSITAGNRPFGLPASSGMCSTCGVTFSSAQDFYEHLDDCVLRVVQQAEPSEAINEKLLSSVMEDEQVQETMERHQLPSGIDLGASTSFDQDDDAEEEDEDDEDDFIDGTYGSSRNGKPGKGAIKARKSLGNSTHPRGVSNQHVGGGSHLTANGGIGKPGPSKGLTRSKNGVPLTGVMTGKGSKRRKNYPLSWGAAPEKMKMKKRVLCVYEGPRRLWKDDMMLDADHEVRIPLQGGDGRAWITDLDVQTLRRAEGVLNATEEEKGPWVENDAELERLMQ